MFDQMIKPILCYASELWSTCDLGERKFHTEDGLAKYLDSIAIEKVHVKFCKFILGVNIKAVNLEVKGELGCFPVSFSSSEPKAHQVSLQYTHAPSSSIHPSSTISKISSETAGPIKVILHVEHPKEHP